MSFKRIPQLLRNLVLPALAAASMAAHAGPFSGIYIFGDSLSDTGTVSDVTGGVFPGTSQPYKDGRFSDGLLWVETFATGLGLTGQASSYRLGGNNYAYAGARTGLISPVDSIPGLLAQAIGIWGAGAGPTLPPADPDALYVVVGGGNDMRDARDAFAGTSEADELGRQAAAAAAIANLANTISYLAASGARNVLISTLPDLGVTPEAVLQGLQTASTDATNRFNALIPTLLGLELIPAFSGLNIEVLDMAGVAAFVRDNKELYGVTNTGLPCDGFLGSAGDSCATSLFSDALHPSALAHRLIGEAALAVYGVPLPGTLALMVLALALLVLVQRRRVDGAQLRLQASGTVS